ncbi:MAG: hypothetical protein QXK89_05030 [Candidatus Bathyarchaeia archaeon]
MSSIIGKWLKATIKSIPVLFGSKFKTRLLGVILSLTFRKTVLCWMLGGGTRKWAIPMAKKGLRVII